MDYGYTDPYAYEATFTMSTPMMIMWGIIAIIGLVSMWMIYKKAGEPGWKVLIPFYNTYTLFKIALGNGWKFLLMLIPFYNIYLFFKLYIELAHKFGKSTAFGFGIAFLSFIFLPMLAFGSAKYGDCE